MTLWTMSSVDQAVLLPSSTCLIAGKWEVGNGFEALTCSDTMVRMLCPARNEHDNNTHSRRHAPLVPLQKCFFLLKSTRLNLCEHHRPSNATLGRCALPGGKVSALSLKRFSVQLQIIACVKEGGRERERRGERGEGGGSSKTEEGRE